MVTISREHGSAGKRIGQLVAEQLGIPYYYKEMIAVVAHESGLTEAKMTKSGTNNLLKLPTSKISLNT